MFSRVTFLCLFFSLVFSSVSHAQLDIPEDNQLYRVKVWRKVDLREKQNKGFFALGREVTKFIAEGIRSGEITLYNAFTTNGLEDPIPQDEVGNTLSRTDAPPVSQYASDILYGSGDIVSYNGTYYSFTSATPASGIPPTDTFYWSEIPVEQTQGQVWEPSDMAEMEVIEDVIFDKVRSRQYYDIEALRILIPGDIRYNYDTNVGENAGPYPIGYVDYDEVEELFRKTEEAKWVNRYNPKEWKNFADAFLLRLFYGPIIKYENPDDAGIQELFETNFDAVMEMHRYEMFLMEKEHNLWEY